MSLVRDAYSMTVEDFLVFTEARPDEERWELIDGEPILSPSPSYGHQKIAMNLAGELRSFELAGADWEVLPGLGAKLSDTSMPIPDVLVRPKRRISGSYCDDIIAAFEVLSPSSHKRDLVWKRQAYAALPSMQHYVVLSQTARDVRCFSRPGDWAELRSTASSDILRLPAIGVEIELERLYRGLDLA